MKLSIIIATCERPESLARLIDSLVPQLNPNRQLLIAENGSTRKSAVPHLPANAIHIYQRTPGKCRVQNLALTQAQGDVLIFLDDDLIVAPDYLDQVELFFVTHPEFAAMKGRVLAAQDPVKLLGEHAVYLDLPLVDHGEKVVEVRGVLGVNMAFRAAVIATVGSFDERLGPGAAGHEEETEMSARIRHAEFRIGYAPRAIVYHEVDPARADPRRYLRIAHERGQCRVIHESHSTMRVRLDWIVAQIRLALARTLRLRAGRLAREQKRLAILNGMLAEIARQRRARFAQ
ncbi:MAG: glycosyltransferase [Candidatus Binataceae bacterium]|nr:glycosyltransferase [Candidatus Binataceae bacterium]